MKGSDLNEGIVLVEEERANLACYFLRSLLRRSARGAAAGKLSARLSGGVKVKTGGMTAYVYGVGQGVEVSPVESGKPAIVVEGDLSTLLSVLLGGGVVLPYLRGDIRVKGNPVRALNVLRALMVKDQGSDPGKNEGR